MEEDSETVKHIRKVTSNMRVILSEDATIPTNARLVVTGLIDLLENSLATQQRNHDLLEQILKRL